jgi:hypothetical protein
MALTNHMPKVWTIHAPTFEWPQCDCPIAGQGFIYKHVMKVCKMLHLDILDVTIIREVGTLHGVHKASTANMSSSNIELGNLDESKQIDDLAALDTMETPDSTTRSNL